MDSGMESMAQEQDRAVQPVAVAAMIRSSALASPHLLCEKWWIQVYFKIIAQ